MITNRIKSYAWRWGGMTFVAVATFIIKADSIFNVDWVALLDFAIIYSLGLLVSEITKVLNTKS